MIIRHSNKLNPSTPNSVITNALKKISQKKLKEFVQKISIPRHFTAEPENNHAIANWIQQQLQNWKYHTFKQGSFENIVAQSAKDFDQAAILIGAHYDSVPGCPGADDNASAVAALLTCAQELANFNLKTPLIFVAFNREEDGLIGSTDFVQNFLLSSSIKIQQVHILEMVGFCNHQSGSQKLPPGLPISIPETGDFLGILSNKHSNFLTEQILKQARSYLPEFPVMGLKIYLGLEKFFPDLGRSDHQPFWDIQIPAVMWTDTSEFRNPHYHQATDTPETLDYSYLQKVTQLLLSQILKEAL